MHFATEPAYLQGLGPEPLQALVRLNPSAAFRRLGPFRPGASAGCLFCTVAYIMNPAFSSVVNVWLFDMPTATFYIGLSCWRLYKGLRGAAAMR